MALLSAIPIIGAAAELYDSYQNRKLSRENTDKTIRANKEESELAYQRDLAMWNRQNEYNTPQAQMQRFTNAGLNPHLIYGQGSSGLASAPPEYAPARQQYAYESMPVSPAINSVLPMMMEVGSWMQNMKLSEAELINKQTNTEKTRQMVDFFTERYPQILTEGRNKQELFPYQRSQQIYNTEAARQKIYEFEQNFRHQYGEELFRDLTGAFGESPPSIGGMKRLEFLKRSLENETAGYNRDIAGAKASWTDLNITDPQALMQMVMSGLLSQVGMHIRRGSRPKITDSVSEQMRGGRIRTRTRTRE